MYSIVIPCYKSSKSIADVVCSIDNVMKSEGEDDYEVIMVDDCSPDETWSELVRLHAEDERRICIRLARNFGQHAALMAGFRAARGDIVITADDDGQTPIEQLWNMKAELDAGYDVVCAKYQEREGFSLFRRVGTEANRFMRKWLLEVPDGLILSMFMMARRFVVDEIIQYTNPYPYMSGLVFRTTHNIGNVDMNQKNRAHGHSGYSLSKLFSLWLNGFTAFSLKPLRVASMLGFVCCVVGMVFGVVLLVRKLVHPSIVIGWTSLMCVILLFCGVMLLMLGLMGEYVGRIYMCINASPQYVVRETLGVPLEKTRPNHVTDFGSVRS